MHPALHFTGVKNGKVFKVTNAALAVTQETKARLGNEGKSRENRKRE